MYIWCTVITSSKNGQYSDEKSDSTVKSMPRSTFDCKMEEYAMHTYAEQFLLGSIK